MKSKINKENIENIPHYGIDIEAQLTSMLSEELAKSIDIEILKNILGDDYYRNKRRSKSIKKIFKINSPITIFIICTNRTSI